MSATRLAVVYADAAEGHAVVVDVGGGQVSVGAPGRFAATKPLSVSVAALDHSSVVRALRLTVCPIQRSVPLVAEKEKSAVHPSLHACFTSARASNSAVMASTWPL